jgi:HEAT repeat protein
MGLLDFFSKEKREERALVNLIRRATHKYMQSPERYRAMEALANLGSERALYGLLSRFGMVYDKSIEDEQEKEWAFDTLAGKGPAALPAVKRYLRSADSVSWPLRLLPKIATKEQEFALVQEVLAEHEPGYERDPTKKVQLLRHLSQLKEPKAPGLVVPYLGDMDEGVRFAAAESLLRLKDEAVARPALLQQFVSDTEESLRLRIRIAEGFAELGWLVQDQRKAVQEKLPEGFQLDREGHILARKPSV